MSVDETETSSIDVIVAVDALDPTGDTLPVTLGRRSVTSATFVLPSAGGTDDLTTKECDDRLAACVLVRLGRI